MSGRWLSTMAKSACLTRSLMGRVPGPGPSRRRPPAEPVMTRPASGTHRLGAGALAGRDVAQPAVAELLGQAGVLDGQAALVVEQLLGHGPAEDGQLLVRLRLQRGESQPGQATLGEAQDVALAAQLPVLLGEQEAVGGGADGLQ